MKCFFALSLLPCLLFSQLSQLHLTDQPQKSSSELVGANIRDANGRICAAVQVISDMDGYTYQAYNGVVRVDDHPGQDMVFLQPDEQVLEIYHSGYEPLKLILRNEGIQLASQAVWVIRIAGDRKAAEIPIVIISDPEGAEVSIDGLNLGTGKQFMTTAGEHELHLQKSGYQPVTQTIQVAETNALFEIKLKEQKDVNIQIDSEPQGASVYLDGVRLPGTTLVNVFYPPGRYSIRLEKEWYVAYEAVIEIQQGMSRQKYTLQPDFGSLTVTSTPQSGLEIMLNNSPQNVSTPHTFERLAPGNYRVRAKSDLYESDEVEVVLGRGERKNLQLNSSISYATLTVRSRPGAVVFLNGVRLDHWDNIRLEPSLITLRAEMQKAQPLEQRLVLKKGEVKTVELMPVLPVGTIQVAAVPVEAAIELRGDAGEFYAATGAGSFTDVPVGTYTLKVSQSGYTEKQETLVLKAGEKITRSVTLERPAVPSPPAIAQPSVGQSTAARPQPPASGAVWRDPKTGIEFELIKGGTFEMGDVFNEGDSDEKPVHTVRVGDFHLGKTEVTVGQFRQFVTASGYRTDAEKEGWAWAYKDGNWGKVEGASWKNPGFAQDENHPVVCVSWNDAMAYCQWAGYRLPTEAEWEYAAREGGRRVRFGNGRDVADPAEMNFDGRSEYKRSYSVAGVFRAKTTPVGSFSANALGLSDMSGNVWEWCMDRYGSYDSGTQINPQGPSSGDLRVLRGGSWGSSPYFCRAAGRGRSSPDGRGDAFGFRVARPAQ